MGSALRTRWTFIRDAAWLVALTIGGLASILIDANVGFPRLLALMTGTAS